VQKEEDNLYPVKLKAKGKQYLLAFCTKDHRYRWTSGLTCLLKVLTGYESEEKLKFFCDFIIRNQETSAKISTLNENREKQAKKLRFLEQKTQDFEDFILKKTVEEIITQVELLLFQEKIEEIRFQVENLESEKVLLNKNQNQLMRILSRKSEEVDLLKESLQCFKDHFKTLSPGLKIEKFSVIIWVLIFRYLHFEELFEICRVNKRFLSFFNIFLKDQKNWKVLASHSLIPRSFSWNRFFTEFTKPLFSVPVIRTSLESFRNYPGLLSKLCTHPKAIQQICMDLCESFNITTCFDELGKIANYLFSVVKDPQKSFEILYSTAFPPYYLVEIWKPGLIRLRLGIFQVQKVLKLRHPYLYQHFKDVDISLDYIIAPWIASVFTCYFVENDENGENSALGLIWDQFITKGWQGIIQSCLALLFLSQGKVIGESLEATLSHYKAPLIAREVASVLGKYTIEASFLNELESSFYFSLEN
jgi:hypothetical protein